MVAGSFFFFFRSNNHFFLTLGCPRWRFHQLREGFLLGCVTLPPRLCLRGNHQVICVLWSFRIKKPTTWWWWGGRGRGGRDDQLSSFERQPACQAYAETVVSPYQTLEPLTPLTSRETGWGGGIWLFGLDGLGIPNWHKSEPTRFSKGSHDLCTWSAWFETSHNCSFVLLVVSSLYTSRFFSCYVLKKLPTSSFKPPKEAIKTGETWPQSNVSLWRYSFPPPSFSSHWWWKLDASQRSSCHS